MPDLRNLREIIICDHQRDIYVGGCRGRQGDVGDSGKCSQCGRRPSDPNVYRTHEAAKRLEQAEKLLNYYREIYDGDCFTHDATADKLRAEIAEFFGGTK